MVFLLCLSGQSGGDETLRYPRYAVHTGNNVVQIAGHPTRAKRDLSLCLPIAVPVVSSVSTPCRLASTARNPVVATSYAIAGKESVPGSSSLRAGPHLSNRCIVRKSVLPATRNR